ncbi:hypothetical protein Mal4_40380 [Maioricimonas rarisocia]|uniref:DNA primase/polymerase bifunctional N-terminal domain-containing protein n=1 Tax=Maioricimonas rarisocia TaxID=2528026 RepID=A0A517ZB19_9PLAN|nr:bifunctional DNA primase/polymerase [Maioricimonas rarisocia]QDU39692.1 hypothetical protein Mal4_40380 [Maioricimonas rarisocia]
MSHVRKVEVVAPSVLDAARDYVRRGWRVVPIPFKQKRPVIKEWKQLCLTEDDLPEYFDQPANVGIILGEPSHWLVDVDLDCPEAIELARQYLPFTPARSGRPGALNSHWWYYASGTGTKKHTDPVDNTMIVELRATGLQTVVGPSVHPDGSQYEILTGEPAIVPAPMLTACVAALAKAVSELRHGSLPEKPTARSLPSTTTGTAHRRECAPHDIERRALAYLDRLPPAISGQGGHAATYAAATVLVHGFELDPEQALGILLDHYNPRCDPPWSGKELRHKVEDAAKKSHNQPRGWLLHHERDQPIDPGVDISTLVGKAIDTVTPASRAPTISDTGSPRICDPGPLPDELLDIPGFVGDVMRFTLDTAPYPNRPLAFVGAIALLGTLTGRKVREPGNIRTNVQILALASSGVGKDWPRKVNASVLLHAEESRKIAGKSASGEGIEDRLIGHPVILKQDDEIDTLFENMRDNKEARYRNQFGMLLELYGEAGGWRAIRDRAGEKPGLIYQPHLVLFGTTTPGEFYGSLSGKMLNKGLLARLITVEAGERGKRKRPDWRDPPESIVSAAKEWSKFRPPGWGNVSDESCGQAVPLVAPFTDESQTALEAFADRCDDAYREAAKSANEPVMAIWARAVEKATQLALIYACSVHGTSPIIERPAVAWASAFIEHTVRRTIFMLGQRFHESEFEQKCQLVLETLTAWQQEHGDEWMPSRDIARKHRWPQKEHDAIRETLLVQERIETAYLKPEGAGRPKFVCRILSEKTADR